MSSRRWREARAHISNAATAPIGDQGRGQCLSSTPRRTGLLGLGGVTARRSPASHELNALPAELDRVHSERFYALFDAMAREEGAPSFWMWYRPRGSRSLRAIAV